MKADIGSPWREQRSFGPLPAGGPFARRFRVRLVSSAREWPERWTPSPCEQSGAHESLAGMLVGEKNRYLRISASVARATPFRGRFCALPGTISGTTMGTIDSA